MGNRICTAGFVEAMERRLLFSNFATAPMTAVSDVATGYRNGVAVDIAEDGRYGTSWTNNSNAQARGVYFRWFSPSGSSLTPAILVEAGQTTSNPNTATAIQPDGTAIICWTVSVANGGNNQIRFQRVASDGTKIGNITDVSDGVGGNCVPAVACDDDGNFIVAWAKGHYYIRKYSSSGVALGDALKVSDVPLVDPNGGYLGNTAFDVADDMSFAIAWTAPDGDSTGIRVRRFGPTGQPLGNSELVNQTTAGTQEYPDLAIASNGTLMVVWDNAAGKSFARTFHSLTGWNSEFQIDVQPRGAAYPTVTSDDSQHFIVATQVLNTGIRIQRFATGTGIDWQATEQAEYYSTTACYNLAIGAAGNGRIAVAGVDLFGESGDASHAMALNISPSIATSNLHLDGVPAISLAFSEALSPSVDAAAFVLQSADTGLPISANFWSFQITSFSPFTSATLSLSVALSDGNYRLLSPAGAITDIAGRNSTSPFSFDFFLLNGDANHDRVVDIRDLAALASNWQRDGAVFSQGDFNYDGVVDAADLSVLALKWQYRLPAPAPLVTSLKVLAPVRSPRRVINLI